MTLVRAAAERRKRSVIGIEPGRITERPAGLGSRLMQLDAPPHDARLTRAARGARPAAPAEVPRPTDPGAPLPGEHGILTEFPIYACSAP
jgi:hypothetical protein